MVVFEALVRSLSDAYARATGRKAAVSYDQYQERHGGPFVRLINVLLPMVGTLAKEMDGRALELPATDYARGQLIKSILRRSRKVENRPAAPRR